LLSFAEGNLATHLPHVGSPSGAYPTLLAADWCPLSKAAGAFWKEAAHIAGSRLRLLTIDSEEGVRLATTENIAGVPCLVLSPTRRFYGLDLSRSEATELLSRHTEIEHA